MNKFEFIRYEPTPGEKHLGIVTMKLYGKMIARYKIVSTKDGQNFFPASASFKIGEQYHHAIMLDSNSDKEELDYLIKANVKAILNGNNPQAPLVQKQSQQQQEQDSFVNSCPF